MITAKPTENLTGVTIEGSHQDLYETVSSIYRMSDLEEDYDDLYWGVKNRLLGLCYDIRHASMGDREIELIDNGVHDEMMKWYSRKLPKEEVHFSVNILLPEAVFVALSVSELYIWSGSYYGQRSKKEEEYMYRPYQEYAFYLRDQATLDTLSAAILSALAEVIGDEELEKLIKLKKRQFGSVFSEFATQYVDKCNIEYLNTTAEKRTAKIKNIARKYIQQPEAYKKMKEELEYMARKYNCSYHELYDPKLEYPEEIIW